MGTVKLLSPNLTTSVAAVAALHSVKVCSKMSQNILETTCYTYVILCYAFVALRTTAKPRNTWAYGDYSYSKPMRYALY